jgi:hypothetical protein
LAAARVEAKVPGKGKADVGEDALLPNLDFATFILSLSHSVLMHLGEAPHPDGDDTHKDLPLARQTIDLLGLLEEKTKGNLTGDEERLLSQVLYDLRLRFVEVSKGKKA